MHTWTRPHRIALGLALVALAIEALMLAPGPYIFFVASSLGILGLLLVIDAMTE